MEKIQFIPEGEDHPVEFFVLGEARLAGRQYLLVTDSGEGEGDALILRAEEDDRTEVTYQIVEDENELSAVLLLMRDSLEELGIEVEL